MSPALRSYRTTHNQRQLPSYVLKAKYTSITSYPFDGAVEPLLFGRKSAIVVVAAPIEHLFLSLLEAQHRALRLRFKPILSIDSAKPDARVTYQSQN